jgi:hypothetical protein
MNKKVSAAKADKPSEWMLEWQLETAIQLLADWCDAVRDKGTDWDNLEEQYETVNQPSCIKKLIDAARSPKPF